MPFTAQQLADAGKIGLDYYLKNKPVDQIDVERVWMNKLDQNKKTMPGAKENAVIQLRYRYQSNFQWFNGRKVVTYNNRQTINQASYPWRSAHDGFSLDEDRLIQNGITVTDDKTAVNTKAEAIQLTNLLTEETEVLGLGYDEKFDQALLRDGTSDTDAIAGLDHLVAIDPTTGTVGGIDRSVAANSWWRNNVSLNLDATTTTGNILSEMETQWRKCRRNGGSPNFIMVGSVFLDKFRDFMMNTYGTMNYQGSTERSIEGGTKEVTFHGIPLTWNPVFEDLDAIESPTEKWEERCYFINTRFIFLKPIANQDMISRRPPRPYDRYEHYWGLTWRGALCMSRANAHSVMSVVP